MGRRPNLRPEEKHISEDERQAFVRLCVKFLPDALQNIISLAQGVRVQIEGPEGPKFDSKGTPIVYRKPPDLRANQYIIDRVLGSPHVEVEESLKRLRTAQAVAAEQTVVLGLLQAQVRELQARAGIKEIEASMWPQQFVTVEEEMSNLQAIAAAANRPILTMTPEQFREVLGVPEGLDWDAAAALEEFKARISVDQSQIVAEVMKYGKDKEDDQDGEDDDA